MNARRRYIVTLGTEEPLEVELTYSPEEGCWWANVDGEQVALNLRSIDLQGRVQAEIDGEAVSLTIFQDDSGYKIGVGGVGATEALPVRARTDGEIVLAAPTAPTATQRAEPVVTSPMSGKVLQVLVTHGQNVDAGQPLCLIESMKMETVIKSPRLGRVAAIRVKTGDPVKTGAPLIELSAT